MEVSLQDFMVAIAGFLTVYYFKELNGSVKEAVKSVDSLNTAVGVIIAKTETHTNEIEILRNKTDTISSDVAHIKAHMEK